MPGAPSRDSDVTGNSANISWTVLIVVGFALLTDYLLYGLVVPLTPYAPAKIGDEAHLGLLYGGYAIGVLCATPLFGAIGDRVGCRRPMIYGVIIAAIATAMFCFADNFYLLLLARILQGAASAASWTAGLALIAEHYPEKRVQMMGMAMMGSTAGSVIGPTLGGWLFGVGGYQLPFMVAGVIVLIDAAMRTFLLPPEKGSAAASTDLKALLMDKSVLVAAVAVGLAASGWGIVEPLVPIHLTRTANATPQAIGLMFTISTIAYGISAGLVSWTSEKLTIRRTICLGMVLMAITLPIVGLMNNVIACGIALCAVSVSYAFLLNPTSAELGNAVDRRGLKCYAAVYAVYNIAYSIGMMGTDVFAATVAPVLSLLGSMLCISVLLICCIPLLLMKGVAPAEPEPTTEV